ncbi:hypothetical protein C0J50_12762, partial [Silurus asotus]
VKLSHILYYTVSASVNNVLSVVICTPHPALYCNRINHDENRRPVDIPEAKCACAGCINPFTMQEDRSMTSVLIYAKIPVRRLQCPNKKKKKCVPRYRTVVESIAVGCTCIAG